jgi:hypothetical protein
LESDLTATVSNLEFAAKLAGEKALRELLDGLTQEGNV